MVLSGTSTRPKINKTPIVFNKSPKNVNNAKSPKKIKEEARKILGAIKPASPMDNDDDDDDDDDDNDSMDESDAEVFNDTYQLKVPKRKSLDGNA